MLHKYIFFLSIVFLTCSFKHDSLLSQKVPQKRRIAIAWSEGGGSHKVMLEALKVSLSDAYDLVPFNPFKLACNIQHIVGDIVRRMCDLLPVPLADDCKKLGMQTESLFERIAEDNAINFEGEAVYNSLLASGYSSLANFLFYISGQLFVYNNALIQERLAAYFREKEIDLVISLIPHIDYSLNAAAGASGIPFLLIAPDFDISTCYFLGHPPTNSFYYTLPFKDSQFIKKAEIAGLSSKWIVGYGLPLRESFFTPKDKTAILEKWRLPTDKSIVMLCMGGIGSQKIVQQIKALLCFSKPLHVIACIGQQHELRDAISSLNFPSNMTVSIINSTPDIAELMAVSDVLINKAGPLSISEAIIMKLPLIIDAVDTPLDWEKPQIRFVEKYAIGAVLKDYNTLSETLNDMLMHKTAYQNNMLALIEQLGNHRLFDTVLKTEINNILNRPKEEQVCYV